MIVLYLDADVKYPFIALRVSLDIVPSNLLWISVLKHFGSSKELDYKE